jgi:hypothetical protein
MTTNESSDTRRAPARRSRKSRYIKGPHLERAQASIYDVMLRVMTATTTVSAAASELGMARTQFQSSLHKAQAAFIAALPEGRTGRPRKLEALRVAEAKMRAQARTIERQRVIVTRSGGHPSKGSIALWSVHEETCT